MPVISRVEMLDLTRPMDVPRARATDECDAEPDASRRSPPPAHVIAALRTNSPDSIWSGAMPAYSLKAPLNPKLKK